MSKLTLQETIKGLQEIITLTEKVMPNVAETAKAAVYYFDYGKHRCEAAEKVIHELLNIIRHNSKRVVLLQEDCPHYNKWQSIVNEQNKGE